MLIIDGAFPMASSAILQDRDLTLPLDEVRSAPKTVRRIEDAPPDSETLATLPEMRRGRIAVAVAKLVQRRYWPGYSTYGYRSDEIVYAMHQGQLAYYRILEAKGEASILKTREDFRAHMATWSASTDTEHLPVGLVVAMEGADGILWPEQVHEWWDAGVRVVALVHTGRTHYAHGYSHTHGDGSSGGLFPPGRELLKEMESLGMILDVTHSSEESVWEALDIFSGPVLASHQNCRALVPGLRQFTDEQIAAVIERGGVIGPLMAANALYSEERHPPLDGRPTREDVSLDHFVDHIDHICQLAGNSFHAGIGADTDGQGGRAGAPREIDTVADYQKVAQFLSRRGYTEGDIENIMYKNWQRLFEEHLPAKA